MRKTPMIASHTDLDGIRYAYGQTFVWAASTGDTIELQAHFNSEDGPLIQLDAGEAAHLNQVDVVRLAAYASELLDAYAAAWTMPSAIHTATVTQMETGDGLRPFYAVCPACRWVSPSAYVEREDAETAADRHNT